MINNVRDDDAAGSYKRFVHRKDVERNLSLL